MHFERSFGAARLLAGLSFSLGLILVVVGGAELFTGNSLLVMAWCARKVSTRALLRNWGIVYAGNFVGALGTALLIKDFAPESFCSTKARFENSSVGQRKKG